MEKNDLRLESPGELLDFYVWFSVETLLDTVEPFLRGHPDERPTPLKRPPDNVHLNINVLTSTSGERSPLLIGQFLCERGGLTRWVAL